jgi:P27 family predicted phage terminase small subunit
MKRTSNAEKVKNGTYRPSTERDETAKFKKLETLPEIPKWMPGEAAEYYKLITESLFSINMLVSADFPIIEILAVEFATYREATLHLSRNGMVSQTMAGIDKTLSPWFTVRSRSLANIRTLSREFGLSIGSRGRIPEIELKKEHDDLFDLLAER